MAPSFKDALYLGTCIAGVSPKVGSAASRRGVMF